jgi:Tol biopolymer transport system component
MRRRRAIASSIAVLTALALATGSVLAADPWVERHSRVGEPRVTLGGDRAPARERSGMDIQSAPGANGKIAFSRAASTEWPASIWVMDANGANPVARTTGATGTGDTEPAWSPGGKFIAFARDVTSSTEDDGDEIYIMNANGTGLKRLTTSAGADFSPSFSPDGAKIVFSSTRAGNLEIYSMNTDGTGVTRLTNNAASDDYPVWSPDNKRIAFASDRAGNVEIYTMNVNGSGVTRMTTNTASDLVPDWSPDGSKLAFASDRSGNFDIWTMNASAGAAATNVTSDPGSEDFSPAWSPDGSLITYDGDPAENFNLDVFVVPAGGGSIGALTTSTGTDEWWPAWQPLPAFPLVDARFSTFKGDIEWIYAEGITAGCSPERYCPDNPVTREQMALFLDRALGLPSTTTDFFTDDNGKTGEAAINRVAAAGITKGCAQTLYCPTANVTRGQMASFLARAFELEAATTDYFTDDNGTTHEADINRIRRAGITTGCGPTTYCPTANVTRGQMAAFLRRALE